jgi:hypothetical protein
VFAHQEQIAEDDNLSALMDDFLARRARRERDDTVYRSSLLSLECERGGRDLKSALLIWDLSQFSQQYTMSRL